MNSLLITPLFLIGPDNDIHHCYLRTAPLFSDRSAEDRFPRSPQTRARQRCGFFNIGHCTLARARPIVISPSCMLGIFSDLCADTNRNFSCSSLTSQRLNRFARLKISSGVLIFTSLADQEPGSQNGHGWSCTTKSLFTREVDQEFRLCSLQTCWILLA